MNLKYLNRIGIYGQQIILYDVNDVAHIVIYVICICINSLIKYLSVGI